MRDEQPNPYLCINQSVETLVGKYLEYENRVKGLKAQATGGEPEAERQRALSFCEDKLREAKAAIFPGRCWRRRKVFLAWQLLHRVSEELILLMDQDELLTHAMTLKLDLKVAPMPETSKGELIAKLGVATQKLDSGAGGHANGKAHQRVAARLFRNIAKAVNDSVDDRFWDLWVQKLIALVYAVLLVAVGALFYYRYYDVFVGQKAYFPPLSILLLGAIGGLASGILSGERESIPKSHFAIPLLYYTVVRPLIGAVAAMALYLALQSEFLIKIYPPLPAGQPSPQAATVPAVKSGSTVSAESNPLSVSTVTMRTADGKQHYLVMLLLLFAGFSGDKLLKTVADRVTMRLIAEAEKTKVAK